MADSLVAKLDPEAMVGEGGLRKAELALRLLLSKASSHPLSPELSSSSTRLLIQTAVLHPMPSLRTAATEVLGACVSEGEPSFLSCALTHRLPAALFRLLREEDRSAPSKGFDAPSDPDLPVRRAAIKALSSLVLRSDEQTRSSVLSDSSSLSLLLLVCGTTDPEVREGALSLTLAVSQLGEGTLAALVQAAEAEAAGTAKALLAAACAPVGEEGGAARLATLQLLSALRAAEALREEMVNAGAGEKLAELKAQMEEPLPPEVTSLIELYTS
ncbi:MAG: hypothetical protein SGPRY_011870 [Prymnesium sp.]